VIEGFSPLGQAVADKKKAAGRRRPRGDFVDAERLIDFGRGVYCGIVTELGAWLLVGRWSRVGEMFE
jgi:hypothetical protein